LLEWLLGNGKGDDRGILTSLGALGKRCIDLL